MTALRLAVGYQSAPIHYPIPRSLPAMRQVDREPLIFFPFFVVTAFYNWDAVELSSRTDMGWCDARVDDATSDGVL